MTSRNELVEKLDIIAPAISAVDFLPVLTHIWFTGEHVMAFNDEIGISTPLKTSFKGAVQGRTLIDLIGATHVKEIDLTEANGNLVIKAASSRFRLPMLPASNFVFKMPDLPKIKAVADDKKELLRASIAHCMRSTTVTDTSVKDRLGITLIMKDKTVDAYATTGVTMSHASFVADDAVIKEGRVILPTSFCKEFLRLGKDGFSFHAASDHALMWTPSVTLFGKLVYSEKPLDYKNVVAAHVRRATKLLEVPPRLKLIAERASIIAGKEGVPTQITAEKGMIKFFTSTKFRGEVSDVLKVPDQPDVQAKIEARVLVDACDDFDRFLITDRCVVMKRADSNRVFLIATWG